MPDYLAPIKKWKPIHEKVVSLHILGWSNDAIAQETDYTTVRVSQILQDPKALEIIEEAKEVIRAQMRENIEDGLAELAEKSVEKLRETIDHTFTKGTAGKHHQDKIAVDLLKGTGFLSKDLGEGGGNQAPALSPELSERLVSALEFANKSLALVAEEETRGIEDAPYEIVEDE